MLSDNAVARISYYTSGRCLLTVTLLIFSCDSRRNWDSIARQAEDPKSASAGTPLSKAMTPFATDDSLLKGDAECGLRAQVVAPVHNDLHITYMDNHDDRFD